MNWTLRDDRGQLRSFGLSRLKRSITALTHWRDRDYRPVFVTGLAGSGNTLIASLLDQEYFTAGFADESALHARRHSCLKVRSTYDHDSLDRYAASLAFPSHLSPETIREDGFREYRRYTESPKQSRVMIDKAPNVHLVRAAELQAAFPDSHFVFMIRDPYEQMEGLLRKWPIYRDAGLAATAEFCRSLIEEFEHATQDFKDHVVTVSLDDLKHDPENILRLLAGTLTLEPRVHPKRRESIENLPGVALRNVQQGEIVIDRQPAAGRDAFTQVERDVIDTNLRKPFERALVRAIR